MHCFRWSGLKSLLVIGLISLALGISQGPAAQAQRCLPSCSAVDGRFIAISGSNLINLSDSTANFSIAAPAATSRERWRTTLQRAAWGRRASSETSASRDSGSASAKRTRAPSLRPIQLACISFTRSGQRSRPRS